MSDHICAATLSTTPHKACVWVSAFLLRHDVRLEMLPSALRVTVGPGELLRFRLQLILLRLEEVLDDGGDQVIQLLPQLRHVAVQGPESSISWNR